MRKIDKSTIFENAMSSNLLVELYTIFIARTHMNSALFGLETGNKWTGIEISAAIETPHPHFYRSYHAWTLDYTVLIYKSWSLLSHIWFWYKNPQTKGLYNSFLALDSLAFYFLFKQKGCILLPEYPSIRMI